MKINIHIKTTIEGKELYDLILRDDYKKREEIINQIITNIKERLIVSERNYIADFQKENRLRKIENRLRKIEERGE